MRLRQMATALIEHDGKLAVMEKKNYWRSA